MHLSEVNMNSQWSNWSEPSCLGGKAKIPCGQPICYGWVTLTSCSVSTSADWRVYKNAMKFSSAWAIIGAWHLHPARWDWRQMGSENLLRRRNITPRRWLYLRVVIIKPVKGML